MSRNSFVRNVSLSILAIVGLVFASPACTDPDPQVGGRKLGLTEMTPLQTQYCAYFSCKEKVPEFESEVDDAFATDLEKNDGVCPEPEHVEYGGDGSILNVKICFPPREVYVRDPLAPYGKPCQKCTLTACYEFRNVSVVYVPTLSNCQDTNSLECLES
jgi:hypothetical protein